MKNIIPLYLDTHYYSGPEQITSVIVFVIITLGLWSLRNTPLGFLWEIYKWIWIILLAALLIDYAKKSIKDWWNS